MSEFSFAWITQLNVNYSIKMLLFAVTFAQAFYRSALNKSADVEFVTCNLRRLRSITLQQSHRLSSVGTVSWNYVYTGGKKEDITLKLSWLHSDQVSCLCMHLYDMIRSQKMVCKNWHQDLTLTVIKPNPNSDLNPNAKADHRFCCPPVLFILSVPFWRVPKLNQSVVLILMLSIALT